uniref:Uncharacterized protein n=1 Tax=Meloidogyne enterolobii TaxID=390850 RepID=A0A6V7YBS9_MELEN|nr:unnamed protein product [Meloidogyne enterolobii]
MKQILIFVMFLIFIMALIDVGMTGKNEQIIKRQYYQQYPMAGMGGGYYGK